MLYGKYCGVGLGKIELKLLRSEIGGRCFKYSKSVLVTGLDVAGVILLVAADNTTATNDTVPMEPTVKNKKEVGVGRRPPDSALKNPGRGKRPAPSRRKLVVSVGGSAINGRFLQPILAGGVEGFHSWGLKVPPVRKELILDGKRSAMSPKANASVAAAYSRGNKPAGTAEASGATPTPRVKRATGESQRKINKVCVTSQITGEVTATQSLSGEVSGAPPTTRGERATGGCHRESLAILRASDDSALSRENMAASVTSTTTGEVGADGQTKVSGIPPPTGGVRVVDGSTGTSGIAPSGLAWWSLPASCKLSAAMPTRHDGWILNGANGNPDKRELSCISLVKTATSGADANLEDRVIRFSRVDSSCESVGVEGLSSGPALSLMHDELSQGSDDEPEGSLAVKPSRRGKAGNTRTLPGETHNHLGGSSGDESEANGGLGQDAPVLDKVRRWWKSKGNNVSRASPQPDTSGSGPAHKAKGRSLPSSCVMWRTTPRWRGSSNPRLESLWRWSGNHGIEYTSSVGRRNLTTPSRRSFLALGSSIGPTSWDESDWSGSW
uniref:Uncharacterized protein n=1 Tax=Timema genevievae TaxID=629358 RepID=A0A7R9JSB2_TIMGE|nr:unnamed protein product [Timema genevievae]